MKRLQGIPGPGNGPEATDSETVIRTFSACFLPILANRQGFRISADVRIDMTPGMTSNRELHVPALDLPRTAGRKLGIQNRMLVALCLMGLLQAVLLGGYALWHLSNSVEEQIGRRALQLAKAVALIPEVMSAVEEKDSNQLNPFIERIRKSGDARFIVVGDANGIRLAHPVSDRIGKAMVGDDNERALKGGESYVSKATGSLGPSIRGKTPIRNTQGDIIGVVSVGYLIDSVTSVIATYQRNILLVIVAGLLFSVIAAVSIAN